MENVLKELDQSVDYIIENINNLSTTEEEKEKLQRILNKMDSLKGNVIVDNQTRLEMEIKGIKISDREIKVYLSENGLKYLDEYDTSSKTNLKQIYQTALAILESIANNPTTMKNYKTEDISVSMFSKNIQNRIEYLNRKVRLMPSDNDNIDFDGGATIGYMFTE